MDVILDQRAIDALALDAQVQQDLRRRADRVVAQAKATAPVDTGAYRASIRRLDLPDADGAVTVTSDLPYAIYVEHGTRQTDRNGRAIHRPHFTLTNALDASGGDS